MRPRLPLLLVRLAALLAAPMLWAQEAITVPSGSRDSPTGATTARGVTFPVEYTAEVLGNLTGGTTQRVIFESLLNAGVALDLEKLAGWKGATVSVRAIYPGGTGLTQAAVHDFNTLSNIDSYDSLRLYDVWLQLETGSLSIRAGQILADAEFFNSDYATLFLNSSFGAIPSVSQNLNPPIFPTAAPGLRLRLAPNESSYAQAAIFSGDVGGPSTSNRHNTRVSFRDADGVLIFAEIGYLVNPKSKEPVADPGLRGSYKLGGDYDSKRFDDAAGGGSQRGNFSLYAVVDQELGRAGNAVFSGFTRIGFAPEDRNTVSWYGDIGVNYKGLLPRRAEDILGLAFSYTRLSGELVQAHGEPLASHHEQVLELTYQAVCNRVLSIQPDLQVIFNPGATAPASAAVVSGVRVNLAF